MDREDRTVRKCRQDLEHRQDIEDRLEIQEIQVRPDRQ